MTIQEAAAALRARKISSVELTTAALERIRALNPRLNAIQTLLEEGALTAARQADDELSKKIDLGPLHGIPIAVKDVFETKGVRTTCGSKLFADFIPDRDAAVVDKLDSAGAVLIGKTGLHELAYGVTSDNPHFGAVRNPRDPERSPGGSSGGSAAAVATEMTFMATGTDTGGSIRIPAAFCGVAGLKPTYGLVDRSGIRPLGFSLDHIGPLTKSVADARLVLDVLAAGARRRPAPANLNGIRIGLPENFYFSQVDAEVRAAVHKSARTAESLGAQVLPVRVPDVDALNTVGRVILLVEASALYETYWDRRDQFGADVLALLDQGRLVPATDYVNAQRLRKTLVKEFHGLFQSIDCLFTPTTPTTAPRIGQKQIEIEGEMHDARLASTRFVRG